MKIVSDGFKHNQRLPKKYTCDGKDVSPPLAFQEIPSETKSLVLIMDDPDAPIGTFTHWVLYNLPATEATLPENLPKSEKLPNGATQGINDFGRIGYNGPCPPPGKPHRYFFKLYALHTSLATAPRKTKKEIEKAMEGKLLAKTELIGLYGR